MVIPDISIQFHLDGTGPQAVDKYYPPDNNPLDFIQIHTDLQSLVLGFVDNDIMITPAQSIVDGRKVKHLSEVNPDKTIYIAEGKMISVDGRLRPERDRYFEASYSIEMNDVTFFNAQFDYTTDLGHGRETFDATIFYEINEEIEEEPVTQITLKRRDLSDLPDEITFDVTESWEMTTFNEATERGERFPEMREIQLIVNILGYAMDKTKLLCKSLIAISSTD